MSKSVYSWHSASMFGQKQKISKLPVQCMTCYISTEGHIIPHAPHFSLPRHQKLHKLRHIPLRMIPSLPFTPATAQHTQHHHNTTSHIVPHATYSSGRQHWQPHNSSHIRFFIPKLLTIPSPPTHTTLQDFPIDSYTITRPPHYSQHQHQQPHFSRPPPHSRPQHQLPHHPPPTPCLTTPAKKFASTPTHSILHCPNANNHNIHRPPCFSLFQHRDQRHRPSIAFITPSLLRLGLHRPVFSILFLHITINLNSDSAFTNSFYQYFLSLPSFIRNPRCYWLISATCEVQTLQYCLYSHSWIRLSDSSRNFSTTKIVSNQALICDDEYNHFRWKIQFYQSEACM